MEDIDDKDKDEPMDTSDPSSELAENFGDAESLSQLKEELRRYIPVLEKMLIDEENDKIKQEIKCILDMIQTYEPGMMNQFQILTFCKTQLDKWIIERPPKPPKVQDVRLVKENGRLIATWTNLKWPLPIQYRGHCKPSAGGKGVLEKFEVTDAETSYALSNVSPIEYYKVTVWAVNSKEQEGEESRSKKVRLCKDFENLFVDDTSPLRPGYRVYKGYMKAASNKLDPVAVKILDLPAEVAGRVIDSENVREVDALLGLKDNRNVVTYRVSGKVPEKQSLGKQIFIAMELCRKDTFAELVKNKKIDMDCCKISLLHMMLGLAAIHEDAIHKAKILHRDLKPQNILRSSDGQNMKIADFGSSKQMDPTKTKQTKSTDKIGTDGWGSPEHYETNGKMSEKSDIFSAGLVSAFGLSHGKHVYGGDSDNWKTSIKRGDEVDLSILACDEVEIAEDMISWMLLRDPDVRPTAEEVLAHPFYWDDEKKLNFLHHMSSFFTPVFLKRIAPEQLTTIIMNNLEEYGEVRTKHGEEKNWVKKMEETPGVSKSYQHVLLTAKGLVPPKTKYDHTSVFDLIRFIRNVEEHYRHGNFLEEFNNSKRNVWKLFYECFPTLICSVYNAVYDHFPKIRNCRDFPNDATRFFTEPAHYQPLPSS